MTKKTTVRLTEKQCSIILDALARYKPILQEKEQYDDVRVVANSMKAVGKAYWEAFFPALQTLYKHD